MAKAKKAESDSSKSSEGHKLYSGKLHGEAISFENGEKVSGDFEVASPMTEEGCFHVFKHNHPNATPGTFVLTEAE